jgi:hypothetical protein
MAEVTRNIGLSLGADSCWPICYQEIMRQLDLRIPFGGDTIRFEVDRVPIEPFDLRTPTRYDLVIDRLTHWYAPRREWIKKDVILHDTYVFNNPWTVQSMEKLTTYAATIRLGFPIPRTWLIPPKTNKPDGDLQVTLERYARLFDLGEIGAELGYPLYMKPYDGGAWKGVTRIEDEEALRAAYDDSGTFIMHLQQAIEPYDRFVRCVGLGPQTRLIAYDPTAPHHDRYTTGRDFLDPEEARLIRDMTLTINSFFRWDFNSCEVLRRSDDGEWFAIDFANPCPDSQVNSLHYHFPWLIKANVRWSVFAATTQRSMAPLAWRRYFGAAEDDMTFREKLDRYVALARRHFDAERFEEFCDRHLSHLDEVAHEFFGTDTARDAIYGKVRQVFPEHEVDEFTELFWQRVQRWRNDHSASGTPL